MYERPPFDLKATFKVRKPFVLDGVAFGYEAIVDVSGIEPRRVRQMFDAHMIDIAEPGAPPPAPAERKQAPPAPATKQARVKAPPASAPAQAAPGVPSLQHRGFGRYEVVDAAGNVLAGPFAKEQAEAELKKRLQ